MPRLVRCGNVPNRNGRDYSTIFSCSQKSFFLKLYFSNRKILTTRWREVLVFHKQTRKG